MDVRIYSCPLQTGWIYCDVRGQSAHVQSVHGDALAAYRHCQHLDQSGVNFQVDVPGFNLKRLREKAGQ